MSDSNDRAREVLGAAHRQIVAFARESYAAVGRGVILIDVPDLPPGTTAMVYTQMVYQALAETRELLADVQGEDRDQEADITLRMIETYDPERQAVVTVGFKTGNPITVKMRLELPVMVDEPPWLH